MMNTPFALLNPVLDSATDEEFDTRLQVHGPIKDDEVPALIEQAKSSQLRTRRNATALLRLTRSPDAKAALQRIVAKTDDEVQYAIALGGFLGEANLASLVRAELLKAALSSRDPEALAVALQVAAKTHQPNVDAAIESALTHSNTKVVQAALRAACEVDPAKFEPRIIAELLKEDALLPYHDLYLALSRSDDAKMGDVFARSLKLGPSARTTDFHNAIYFSEQRKPWLRSLLLELLKQGGELSNSAFHILESWGDSDKVLCSVCIEALQHAPPATDKTYRRYMIDQEQCRVYLGKLAGRAPYTWEERDAALAFAQMWLSGAGRAP